MGNREIWDMRDIGEERDGSDNSRLLLQLYLLKSLLSLWFLWSLLSLPSLWSLLSLLSLLSPFNLSPQPYFLSEWR